VLRQMPTGVPRRGGSVYRYREADATLVVYVCSKHCALASDAFLLRFASGPFGRVIGFRGVTILVTGQPRARSRVLTKVHPVVSELTPSGHEGRCFPR
jgi:hypothetical protein